MYVKICAIFLVLHFLNINSEHLPIIRVMSVLISLCYIANLQGVEQTLLLHVFIYIGLLQVDFGRQYRRSRQSSRRTSSCGWFAVTRAWFCGLEFYRRIGRCFAVFTHVIHYTFLLEAFPDSIWLDYVLIKIPSSKRKFTEKAFPSVILMPFILAITTSHLQSTLHTTIAKVHVKTRNILGKRYCCTRFYLALVCSKRLDFGLKCSIIRDHLQSC